MSGCVLLIQPDGSFTASEYSGEEPKLEVLQAAVDGYIELVRVMVGGQQYLAYVNEEGRIRGLPLNHQGTFLCMPFGYGAICGPIAIVVPT